jgi:hypothetical protein
MEVKKIISLYKIVSKYLPEVIFNIVSSYLEKNLWDYKPHSSFDEDFFEEEPEFSAEDLYYGRDNRGVYARVDVSWNDYIDHIDCKYSLPPCNRFYWKRDNSNCGQFYLWNSNSSDRFRIFVEDSDQEVIKTYLTSYCNFHPILDIH